MIDKGECDEGFIWNRSNCDFKCDKTCDTGEYIDYENWKCRRKIIDKLVEKCSKNIDGIVTNYNETLNDYEKYVIFV